MLAHDALILLSLSRQTTNPAGLEARAGEIDMDVEIIAVSVARMIRDGMLRLDDHGRYLITEAGRTALRSKSLVFTPGISADQMRALEQAGLVRSES